MKGKSNMLVGVGMLALILAAVVYIGSTTGLFAIPSQPDDQGPGPSSGCEYSPRHI